MTQADVLKRGKADRNIEEIRSEAEVTQVSPDKSEVGMGERIFVLIDTPDVESKVRKLQGQDAPAAADIEDLTIPLFQAVYRERNFDDTLVDGIARPNEGGPAR